MIRNNVEPDKVTSVSYYAALLECKRRGGTQEDATDKKKSYFSYRMEDYQEKLNKHQDDENRSVNRNSNLSGSAAQNRYSSDLKEYEDDGVDFGDVLERRSTN